jgi:hypothetical protein
MPSSVSNSVASTTIETTTTNTNNHELSQRQMTIANSERFSDEQHEIDLSAFCSEFQSRGFKYAAPIKFLYGVFDLHHNGHTFLTESLEATEKKIRESPDLQAAKKRKIAQSQPTKAVRAASGRRVLSFGKTASSPAKVLRKQKMSVPPKQTQMPAQLQHAPSVQLSFDMTKLAAYNGALPMIPQAQAQALFQPFFYPMYQQQASFMALQPQWSAPQQSVYGSCPPFPSCPAQQAQMWANAEPCAMLADQEAAYRQNAAQQQMPSQLDLQSQIDTMQQFGDELPLYQEALTDTSRTLSQPELPIIAVPIGVVLPSPTTPDAQPIDQHGVRTLAGPVGAIMPFQSEIEAMQQFGDELLLYQEAITDHPQTLSQPEMPIVTVPAAFSSPSTPDAQPVDRHGVCIQAFPIGAVMPRAPTNKPSDSFLEATELLNIESGPDFDIPPAASSTPSTALPTIISACTSTSPTLASISPITSPTPDRTCSSASPAQDSGYSSASSDDMEDLFGSPPPDNFHIYLPSPSKKNLDPRKATTTDRMCV